MGKLQFKNTEIKLDIEDHIFYVDIFDDVVNQGLKDLLSFAEKTAQKGDFDSYEALIDELIPMLDKILGEGAIDQIFDGNRPKMGHVIQLIEYIDDEFSKQRVDSFRLKYVKND